MQQSNFEKFKNSAKLEFFDIAETRENGRAVRTRVMRRGADRKELIKTVRKIADGFDDIDLRKPVSDYQYRKARKTLALFIEATDARYIPIRPSKKNRKNYAALADLPDNFKIYPVPVSGDVTSFEFKDGKIIERGPFIDYTTYLFPDQIAFAKAQKREIRKLLKNVKAAEKFDFSKPGKKQLRIKTGKYHTHVEYAENMIEETIMDWNNAYGREKVNQFVRGFVVAEFHNQKRKVKKQVKKKKIRKNTKR